MRKPLTSLSAPKAWMGKLAKMVFAYGWFIKQLAFLRIHVLKKVPSELNVENVNQRAVIHALKLKAMKYAQMDVFLIKY